MFEFQQKIIYIVPGADNEAEQIARALCSHLRNTHDDVTVYNGGPFETHVVVNTSARFENL